MAWISNRTITGFIVYDSKFKGHLILSRNFCMKIVTNVTTDRFQITHPTDSMHNIHILILNGFIYDVVLYYCYFTTLKTRYDNWPNNTFSIITPTFILPRKRYGISKRFQNIIGLRMNCIYALVCNEFTGLFHGLKLAFLQYFQEDLGMEQVFVIWWLGNIMNILCEWKVLALFLIVKRFFLGCRLLFNVLIFLRASKTLPEFSGFKGRVYPGQIKPRYQKPEPRRVLYPEDLHNDWKKIGSKRTKFDDLGLPLPKNYQNTLTPVESE